MMQKVGFGGGCHWCTEGVFQSVKGVKIVLQGWIKSRAENSSFSEAVLVSFDPAKVELKTMIEIHLHTHSATSNHQMRTKYRSAVYVFNQTQLLLSKKYIQNFQKDFPKPIITQVLAFQSFRLNQESYLDYYYKNPEKTFCKTYIQPKIQYLKENFREQIIVNTP